MRAEDMITVVAYYNDVLLLQHSSTKCISYEINNSRPIHYIKQPKCFEITSTLPDKKKKRSCLSHACVNLSLFKDLNPCHAPLSVTDYEK